MQFATPNYFDRESKVTTRVETNAATGVTYVGTAAPGTPEAAPRWQIQKITETVVGDVTTTSVTYPDGDNTYRYVWTDRASLTYS